MPSISTIVECEINSPLWEASADFASGVRRLFASETPLDTENQPATAQTISSKTSAPSVAPMRRPQRARLGVAVPGPR